MPVSRRSSLLALAIAPMLAAISLTAARADTAKYTQDAFAQATKAGKAVLVDVTASWCPTCKAQAPVIKDLTSVGDYKDFVVLEVDFDSQKDVLKTFKVQSQSTLIAFKGDKETGRSVGQTSKEQISALLKTAK